MSTLVFCHLMSNLEGLEMWHTIMKVWLLLFMFYWRLKSMMIFRKIVISSLIFFSWFFLYLVFSDDVNTRYTEFYLLSGWEYSNHLVINLTWGETWYVDLYLKNLSDSTFDWKFSFVDWDMLYYLMYHVEIPAHLRGDLVLYKRKNK